MGVVRQLHFKVNPSVLYQLGESLISDSVQALLELVKNSYDADASYAKVIIDTNAKVDIPGTIYPSPRGRIIVEDDGHGMEFEDIEDGWLSISNRKKLELKQANILTSRKRTPLGDKGLGRLGVQRLGENVEIFTKSRNGTGYHFGFSWKDFADVDSLEKIKIHLVERPFQRNHGTKVVVSNLREIEFWQSRESINVLQQRLSEVISPYEEIRDFIVYVELDGQRISLIELNNRIREIAPIRYKIAFDGATLSVEGKARLDFFRPSSSKPKQQDEFALLVESDNGQAFCKFLLEHRHANLFQLSRPQSKNWFVEFSLKRTLDQIDKIKRDPITNTIANPGPFTGEVAYFDFAPGASTQQSVFGRLNEFREHIKKISGIRVYRDGFAVRVAPDWLKLGEGWTAGGSWYGLKPKNTLGYISLSAHDNIVLEETTNREDFKDTPHYRNFYALLTEFVSFTAKAQGFLGRSWVEFRKNKSEQRANVDARKTVEDISQTIKEGLLEAPMHQKRLEAISMRFESSIIESRAVVAKLTLTSNITPQVQKKITDTLRTLEPLIKEAQSVIAQTSGYLKDLGTLKEMGQVLEDRVDGLRKQMDDTYETIALGITAEALSHEVFNVADHLAQRTKTVQTQLRNKGAEERITLAFIEYVLSSVTALRKQMSFLSPALRFVREQKHNIEIGDFLFELTDFYHERLARNGVSIKVITRTQEPFAVRMNKGKLTQIVDNFVLNSEYWLKEEIAQKRISQGNITIEVNRPFIRIYDDGRGIDPSIESVLFEPFISTKAKGKGRGLGLFIVKQLLDSEGCSVGIVPERNKHNRLYKFQIDFRGVTYE